MASRDLGFLALEPREPELQLLHRCFDNWRGIGDVVTADGPAGLPGRPRRPRRRPVDRHGRLLCVSRP